MSDIPMAYDYYADGMIEDAMNTPLRIAPETVLMEVQALRYVLIDLVDALRWDHADPGGVMVDIKRRLSEIARQRVE